MRFALLTSAALVVAATVAHARRGTLFVAGQSPDAGAHLDFVDERAVPRRGSRDHAVGARRAGHHDQRQGACTAQLAGDTDRAVDRRPAFRRHGAAGCAHYLDGDELGVLQRDVEPDDAETGWPVDRVGRANWSSELSVREPVDAPNWRVFGDAVYTLASP